jgi:hypothetical protein
MPQDIPIARRRSRALLAAPICAALAGPVGRAAGDEALAAAVQACAAIARDAERLACYDRSVAPLASGAPAATVPAPSPEELFGIEAGTTPEPEQPRVPEREELAEITARVTGLKRLARGESEIELENGQVWRQLETRELLLKVGDSVTIARAALGAFRLTTPTGRVTRVTRVR